MSVKVAKINLESLKTLEKFITPIDNPKFFFTMTEINKVGINPTSKYNTPLGIYCYQLTKEYYNALITNTLPYVGRQPYIVVFSINAPTMNMGSYSENDLKRDTNTLRFMFDLKKTKRNLTDAEFASILEDKTKEEHDAIVASFSGKNYPETEHATITKAFTEARHQTPIGKFWNLSRVLSKNPKDWNYLLRKIGYTNFSDPGLSVIHPNEPTQAVILDPRILVPIESFLNPHFTSEDYTTNATKMTPADQRVLNQKLNQKQKLINRIENITNPEVLDKIVKEQIRNHNLEIVKKIAKNSKISSETLAFIVNNIDPKNYTSNQIFETLIVNTKLPIQLAKDIIFKYNFKTIQNLSDLITRPDITSEILLSLLDLYKPDSYIYNQMIESIVNSPEATPEIFKEILKKPLSNDVIRAIITSDKCPLEILEQLLEFQEDDKDSEESIRGQINQDKLVELIASSPNSSADLLMKIVKKYNVGLSFRIFKDIMQNNNVNSEIINKMYLDTVNPEILHYLANNDKTPPEILSELAKKTQFQSIIAGNPNTPANTLSYLAKNGAGYIKNIIASNPNTSIEILEELSNTKDISIKKSLFNNPNISESLIEKLYNNDQYPGDFWEHLAEITQSSKVLQFLYDVQLADDVSGKIKQKMANNRNTPINILKDFANSSNEMIRDNALRSLAVKYKNHINEITDSRIITELCSNFTLDDQQYIDILNNKYTNKKDIQKIVEWNYSLLLQNEKIYDALLTNPKIDDSIAFYLLNILFNLQNTNPIKTKYLIKLLDCPTISEKIINSIIAHAKYNNINGLNTHINNMKKASFIPVIKTAKELSLAKIKKLPYQMLNRMISKMRNYLKKNEIVQKMFKDYEVDIKELDYIPMCFGDIDVSAKTDHAVIIFNYQLLTDNDFIKDYSYGVHEVTHWLQQTTGKKATKSSDDGDYLSNPYEQEGFQNQIEYIAEQYGEEEAEEYTSDLLEHHEVDDKKEKKKLETILLKEV
jgi:hypothetical protein